MSLILLALMAAVPEPTRHVSSTVLCRDPAVQRIQPGDSAEMKRLDRLPPAETYLAVLHKENGCTRPILAREYRQGPGRPR